MANEQNLSQLLDAEYGEKIPSQKCKDLVLEYIKNTQSISDRSIEFIKTITKVATNIHKSDPQCLENYLERVYQYHAEGIEKIEENYPEKSAKIEKNETHLHGHAGDIARKLFKKTNDPSWLDKSHCHLVLAAQQSEGTDQVYSSASYCSASKSALMMFKTINDAYWLEQAYKLRSKAAELAKDFDPKHHAHCYLFLGEIAQELYAANKDITWAKKAYSANLMAIELFEKYDPYIVSKKHANAGDLAKLFYIITKRNKWAKKAIWHYKNYIKYNEEHPSTEEARISSKLKLRVRALNFERKHKKDARLKDINKAYQLA